MRPLKDSGLADRNTKWTNFWCGLSCHLDFGGAWPSPPCSNISGYIRKEPSMSELASYATECQ